jgi:dihydroorotase-like cyclic amidohydrolase
MMYDLLVKDCRLVRPDAVVACSVGVRDGRVAALLDASERPEAKRVVDAGGRHVVPGLLDTHVHLGNAGRPFEQDVRTESRAAATGGITTMLVYVVHPGSYDEVLPDYRRAVEDGSLVDMLFHLAIVRPEQIPDIRGYANRHGVRSFKAFMAYKGREVSPSGIQGVTDGELFDYFRQVATVPGGVALVHCENIELIAWAQQPFIEADRQDTAAWSDARPAFGELESIRRALTFAEQAGVHFALPHMGIGSGSEFMRQKRWGHARLTVETCPHYLLLDKDVDRGAAGKVNPPLRERAQVDALWERLLDDTVDMIGSDHCPYTWQENKGPDLWAARPGITGGTAMILPVLLSEGVRTGCLPITRMVELTAARPARLFGLYPRKGALDIGSDADLVILDEDRTVLVTPAALNSVSDFTPYEGYVAHGWAGVTIAGGRVVYEEGRLVGEPGHARALARDAE